MKNCNKCNIDLDLDFFCNDKRNKDGKQSTCKDCSNKIRKEKYNNNKTYRESQKKRQRKYNNYANKNAKKHIKNLSDFYIIKELKRGTSLTTEDIKKHPELIELKKQIIKNKRICRKLKT